MLLGNKEKVIRLHAENFLSGDITFDYGLNEDERSALASSSQNLASLFLKWLGEEKKDNKSEEFKKTTIDLYAAIIGWRVRGRIKGKLQDVDLEARIEELVKEKAILQDEVKSQKELGLKALNELKEFDRTIAGLEAQIFYLKKK